MRVFVVALLCISNSLADARRVRDDGDEYPLRVMVMGDWGQELTSSARPNQERTARAMGKYLEDNPDIAYIVSTGDNFYCCGVDSPDSIRFDNTWRYPYIVEEYPVMASKKWYITVGNHDHTSNDDELNQVYFGDTEEQWYFPWLWYNFTTVSEDFTVDWVAFDSQALRHNKHNRPLQEAFLDNTMRDSNADYLIAVGHHPAQNAGRHGGSGTIRNRVVTKMLDHDADLLIVGHDHNQQHIARADEEEAESHIDYVITGGGGRHLYPINQNNLDELEGNGFELKKFSQNFGFVIMKFNDEEMVVDYYEVVDDDDGDADYSFFYSFSRPNRRRDILKKRRQSAGTH